MARPEPGDAGITSDGFLGGRLTILQPRSGYRAGVDPVLLAASVPARSGETVLDLGCGVGTATLCLAARVDGLSLAGLEIQPPYADLARRNAEQNAVPVEVFTGDLAAMPIELRARSFDHVMMNPPYWRRSKRSPSLDDGRESAFSESVTPEAWCDAALRRLRPRGWLTAIMAAERLPELLTAIGDRAGSCEVLPLASRAGRPASRILLRARKQSRRPFRLLAPMILHKGSGHGDDAPDYTQPIAAVLRDAAPLEFPEPGPNAP